MAEVYAGFVSYTDHEIGRLIDYLEESGQLDNTIVVVVSDNGASGEGGPNGSLNENKFFNDVADDDRGEPAADRRARHAALLQPLQQRLGLGVRHAVPVLEALRRLRGRHRRHVHRRWPAGIAARGEVRDQYVHAVDIVPTLYDLLGVEPPGVLKGYTQTAIEGESFAAALADAAAPGRETQFFSMLGQRAIYDQGWLANTIHPPISGWGDFEADQWELYHLAEDRTQLHDLAAERARSPRTAQGPVVLLGRQAQRPAARRPHARSSSSPRSGRGRARRATATSTTRAPPRSPSRVAVNIRRRSYTVAAAVEIDEAPEGVLFAQGGIAGGHSLFVQDGRLHYVYNWLGERRQTITSDVDVPAGRHVLSAEFHKTGDDPATGSATGTLTLYIDEQAVGSDEIMTQPGMFALAGDGLTVGRDSGSPVTPAYRPPIAFRGGTIERVIVDVSGDAFVDHEKEVAAWLARD